MTGRRIPVTRASDRRALRRLTDEQRAALRRLETAAAHEHYSTYKTHLPAADQTARQVGIVLHDPTRTVVTYCGQVFVLTAVDCWLVVTKPERATCQRCRRSHESQWARAFGPDD